MKTPRILLTTIAAVLLTPSLHAQTWDGGGVNDNFNTAANWNLNVVPANNGTANLIFGGAVRLTPVVNVNFDVNGVTFNNTSGLFNLNPSGGTTLAVRGGGITNNDADFQTFNVPVNFAAGSAITASSGGLVFNGAVGLGSNAVTVSGGFDTFMNAITGTGGLVKNGAGALIISPSGSQTYDLTLNSGTVNYNGSATFLSTANLTVAGGTLDMDSNLTLSSGATLNVGTGASFSFPASRTLTVQSASSASFATGLLTAANSIYRVTGTGSTLALTGFFVSDGGAAEVLSGGSLDTTGGFVLIGSAGTSGSILVDGPTSTYAGVAVSIGTGVGGTGALSFSNGATGSFASSTLTLANSNASNGTLTVRSGAQLTTGTVDVGHLVSSGAGTVLVSGGGSRLIATFNIADFSIGGTSDGTGVVTVADGGELVLGGPLTIGDTGTLNIDGGIVTMALGADFTNNGALHFNSGRFTVGENLNFGGGASPFGANITLQAGKELIVSSSRATTLGAGGAIVIDGGVFSTGTLVNSGGTLDFRRGTLRLTGGATLSIGTGGPLGANVTLPAGSALVLSSNVTTVAANGTLTVAGGVFSSGNLTNNGSALIQTGSATMQSFTNNAGAQAIFGGTLSLTVSFTNLSGARLELAGGSGRLIGAGTVQNSGLLLGDGTITNSTTNTATGKIRADTGRTLFFTGTFLGNDGELQLQGGTLDFSGAITNSATGFITGRGALYAAGITNNGQMAFSGGTTDIHGDVTNAAGGRIVTSGAGTTTFFDDVIHNGTEIRTSAGGASVFFGAVSGAGPFTGTGTVYFEGDLRPGNSPASVLYEGDLVLGGSATLTLELGGILLGGGYDHLNIGGTFTADGALDVVIYNGFVPHFGDTFDLFDARNLAGSFDAIKLPKLVDGLTWDDSQFSTNGTLRVVPEPGVGVLLVSALALLGLRRRHALRAPLHLIS